MIIDLKHRVNDYTCMWNGIEDIYIQKTNENIPLDLFFLLSSSSNFSYIKTNKSDVKRMINFSDGRTRSMFEKVHEIIGFDYQFKEFSSFEKLLKQCKEEISCGYPVLLGILDMFYLEYLEKFYKKTHIPFHYVLMIGFDDEKNEIYLYDCSRAEIVQLSYNNLKDALNCEYKGLSKKNTICKIRMDNPKSLKNILTEVFKVNSENYLNPKMSFLGINGVNKVAAEIDGFESELGFTETIKIYKNMIEFFGSVPKLPNSLLGIDEEDEITYTCNRDRLSNMFQNLFSIYKKKELHDISVLFSKSAVVFSDLASIMVDRVKKGSTNDGIQLKEYILKIGDLESQAYNIMFDISNEKEW